MPPMLRATLMLCLCALASPAQTTFDTVLARHSPCDLDGDGEAEIAMLRALGGAGAAAAPRVVVLVEQRLLRGRDGVDPGHGRELQQRLQRFADDLAADGYRAELVAAEVHAGPRRQDGKTLLAMRRLLQACRADGPLAGAILVGHFPDALLLRSCNWRRNDAVELLDADGKPVQLAAGTPWLRRITELVAHRCDLVLADLDGFWEGRYREAECEYPGVMAAFADGVPDGGGVCTARKPAPVRYADAFLVDDGTAGFDAASRRLALDDAARDHECSDDDRRAGNPIAQPDIAVSRLDARGVALRPDPRLLDAHGQPRAVEFAEGEAMPSWADVWQPDPDLELSLLIEYFDRNHLWRTTAPPASQFKPASISWGLGSGLGELRAASPRWREFAEAGYDVHNDVDLCALVEWLRRPAVLRTLRAHSNGQFAAFAKTDAGRLAEVIGSVPWSWTPQRRALVPSLHASSHGGGADFFLYRTLWADRALPEFPYLLVHTGCEAVSPAGAGSLPYSDPRYGRRGQAESLLFYTPCLALVGRAKVFYDEPRGFSAALGRGDTFGDAWRGYFAIEAAAKDWGEVGGDIGRKRSYFWSMLGDWTLRLVPPAP